MNSSGFGPTLVTGGSGLLGSQLLRDLLTKPEYGPIFSISRNPTSNLLTGVEYKACDLIDELKVLQTVQEIKPRTVFHTASPSDGDYNTPTKSFGDVNITGTNNLLSAISKVETVRALVFSSTVSVIQSKGTDMAPESTPYWQKPGGDCLPYYWSKAVAEQKVLEVNQTTPGLQTVALRVCLTYGPGDRQCVPNLLNTVKGGQSNVQLGDNSNTIDLLSVQGSSNAHIRAAYLLYHPEQANGKVAGEAFNITDGQPVKFWDFMRLVYRLCGDTTKPEDVKVIPAWIAMGLAITAEAVYHVITAGTKRPAQLNRTLVMHSVRTYTYDISKARRVLGYEPIPRMEEGFKEAVRYEFEKRGETPPASAK